jgi:class 3 adenylate cyclase
MSGAPLPVGTVTFLFSDIEGSSDLVRSVGNSVFAAVRGDHRRLLRESFAAHGGHEIDTAGDGFFVAFDSARNAVAAAASAQASLAAFSWPTDAEVRVRMGLHTAEPHLSGEGYVGIGVHRAARICEAARGGQILASNATAGIIEDAELPGIELVDLGTHRLKGLPYAQRLFQVTVEGLPSSFDRPRTGESRPPGAGTFLLTDLMGFRHLIRTLGDERSTSLAAEYLALVSGLVEDEGGIVLERAGDSVVGVFADAGNAIRAAAAIRGAVADFGSGFWPRCSSPSRCSSRRRRPRSSPATLLRHSCATSASGRSRTKTSRSVFTSCPNKRRRAHDGGRGARARRSRQPARGRSRGRGR